MIIASLILQLVALATLVMGTPRQWRQFARPHWPDRWRRRCRRAGWAGLVESLVWAWFGAHGDGPRMVLLWCGALAAQGVVVALVCSWHAQRRATFATRRQSKLADLNH